MNKWLKNESYTGITSFVKIPHLFEFTQEQSCGSDPRNKTWERRDSETGLAEFFRSSLQEACRTPYIRELPPSSFGLHFRLHRLLQAQLQRRAWGWKLEKYVINIWKAMLSMNRKFFITASVQVRGKPTDVIWSIKSICYSFILMVFRYAMQVINGIYVLGTKPSFLSFVSLPTCFRCNIGVCFYNIKMQVHSM